MKNYSYLFPGGRTKALTFSYDDGVIADRRLIEIFRENGLKGTFNLNGASLCADKVSCWARYPQTRVRHVDAAVRFRRFMKVWRLRDTVCSICVWRI